MRLLVTIALATVSLAAFAPAVASASGSVRFGIQDDAWLTHGPGTLDERLDRLEGLGVDLVRFNLHWNRIEPTRGSPDWAESDALLRGLRARKIAALVGLVGSPGWSNGGRPPNFAPKAADFAAFARAAAQRYRWVRDWLVWNEPNQARWLRPTSPAVYVRTLLNPAYAAIHAANPRARVGGGVTAPRAGSNGVSPVTWIRGMKTARARLDAYAHHPYPARPTDTPFAGGCAQATCRTITMATLERLLAETQRAFGPKRIWLTEYAYQTGRFGVSERRQAELIGQSALRVARAPRVDMLIHYLVRDEPQESRFQSGLLRLSGVAKPAAAAFSFPLAFAGRSGGKAVLWGQVRPRSGPQTYRLQLRTSGGWRWAGPNRRTSSRGFLSAAVVAPRGTLARIWSPRDGVFSAVSVAAPLAKRGEHDDRDGDRDRDPRQAHHAEGAALAGARAGLGRVWIERRRRLVGALVVAFEHLRIVLNLSLGHASGVPARLPSEACTLLQSSVAASRFASRASSSASSSARSASSCSSSRSSACRRGTSSIRGLQSRRGSRSGPRTSSSRSRCCSSPGACARTSGSGHCSMRR